jgi:hypothetical protein
MYDIINLFIIFGIILSILSLLIRSYALLPIRHSIFMYIYVRREYIISRTPSIPHVNTPNKI